MGPPDGASKLSIGIKGTQLGNAQPLTAGAGRQTAGSYLNGAQLTNHVQIGGQYWTLASTAAGLSYAASNV